MTLRYSDITYSSLVNGPGVRNVLHLQGCTIHCKGCFNKHTWPHKGGNVKGVYEVAYLLTKDSPDAITLSGGEPTEQWEEVVKLLKQCHKIKSGIDVLMFSGLTEDQLEERGILKEAFSPFHESKSLVSTIVSGPYDIDNPSDEYLLGSSNQKILTWDERPIVGSGPRVEVQITEDGFARVTGFPGEDTLKHLTKNFRRV